MTPHPPPPLPPPVLTASCYFQIRGRCQLFFTVACVVSATVCFSAAIVSRSVQLFVCLSIGLNLVVGLALTFDPKEWPHRLQEALLYVVFLCEWVALDVF